MKLSKRISQQNRSSFIQRSRRHLVDYFMEEFGFTQQLASILVYAHDCTTKTEALELFVMDDNNRYNHIFIPSEKSDSCIICQSSQQSHSLIDLGLVQKAKQDYSKDKLVFQEQKKQKPIIFVEYQKITCEICYIEYNKNDIVQIDGISHNICFTCMNEYIKQEINNMRVQNINCPHCSLKFTQQFIKEFIDSPTFDKYKTFIKNIQIQKNPNLKWCPNPKCSIVISIQNNKKVFKCPKCSIQICAKCNREAHPRKSCNSVFKSQIKNWQIASDIQKCKKCLSLVQKISGCNHMSCSVCGHEWCWLCGANYSEAHFSPLNPLGCPGMQDRHGIGIIRIFFMRLAIFILILIGLPIGIPIGMIVAGPIVLTIWLIDECRVYTCFKRFLVVFTGILVGFLLNPVIWIGLIIYYLPKGISHLVYLYRRRRRSAQNSKNRLHQRLINDAETDEKIQIYEEKAQEIST